MAIMNEVDQGRMNQLCVRHDELMRMYTLFSARCGELNHLIGVQLMNEEFSRRLKELEQKMEKIES